MDFIYVEKYDLAYSRNFDKAIKFQNDFDCNSTMNIYSALHCFELLKFYQDKSLIQLEKQTLFLEEKLILIQKKVGSYFNSVLLEELEKDLESKKVKINNNFKRILTEALIKYKRLDPTNIKSLLYNGFISIDCILLNKNIVSSNNLLIISYLESIETGIEKVINKYDNPRTKGKYYLPVISKEIINDMIIKYLDSQSCDLDYLELLQLHKDSNSSYSIEVKTRLKIRQKIEELKKNKYILKRIGFEFSIEIRPEQEEVIKFEQEENNLHCFISGTWINKYTDYPTILNNFIYVFEMVDPNGEINHLFNPRDHNGLSDLFETKHVNSYGNNQFNLNALIQNHLFAFYYDYLKETKKIEVETLIEWFFSEYLNREFGINGFRIKIERSGSFLSRCRNVSIEIESILRQYKVFVEQKEINNELLEVYDQVSDCLQCPSLLQDKYLVIKENVDLDNIMYYLFSDQSLLCYVNDMKNANTFYELMSDQMCDIYYFEYRDCLEQAIDFLIKQNILLKDDRGKLDWKNKRVIESIKRLYEFGFYESKNDFYQLNNIFDSFTKKGWVEPANGLFSPQEQDYLSYYLNNKKYVNGPCLRNKYCHGGGENLSEEENKRNYYVMLRLIILIIIKINDELCFYYKNNRD